MRKLNEMFHIDGEMLIKTSNGQPVPDDEPVFILRGRDALSLSALRHYIFLCTQYGVPTDRLDALRGVERKFFDFSMGKKIKIPGSTHGA